MGLERVKPSGTSGLPALELGAGLGDALGFGVAEGEGVALGFGVAEGEGVALGFGVAEGEGVAVTTEITVLTGVVAIVTSVATAIFFTTAGVTGAGLLEFEFEEPEFLFQIAVQVILLVPTVTTVFAAVVTELQLQPANV